MIGSTLLASLPLLLPLRVPRGAAETKAEEAAIAAKAIERADSLMQVSEILIAGELLDAVVRDVFNVVVREVSLTSAVCTFNRAPSVEWHAPGVSAERVGVAMSRAAVV